RELHRHSEMAERIAEDVASGRFPRRATTWRDQPVEYGSIDAEARSEFAAESHVLDAAGLVEHQDGIGPYLAGQRLRRLVTWCATNDDIDGETSAPGRRTRA